MTLHMTDAGLDFICRQEVFKPRSYPDQAGKPTIGYGHLIRPGETFGTITEPEALALLKLDVARITKPVAEALRVELKPYQIDAVMSLAFNCGGAAIARSTLLRHVNAGNIGAAADQFKVWNKITVKGKKVVSKGLSARRERERRLFLFADYGDSGE
jgi:lysozyme